MAMTGILYIVATPIGNLEDITLRAIKMLKEADIILAEDTRVTGKLLSFLTTNHQLPATKLTSYHQHSPESKRLEVLKYLTEGKNIALVTDAGTPGVSDPGNELIAYLMSHIPDLKIIPIPGPSSITTALSVSGFRAGEFDFLGYFPKKGASKVIDHIKNSGKTAVFFDSPYRIIKTVEKLIEGLGEDRKVFLAQEMTKMNERYFRGTLDELKLSLQKEKSELGRVKGEIVFVV